MITEFTEENRWLSNFALVDVVFDGVTYPSVEHAYVAAKTLNPEIRKEVSKLNSPGSAKRFGRLMTVRYDWDEVKLGIMESLLKQKFKNKKFADKLFETGDCLIVEGNNWHDNYWGSCSCLWCESVQKQNNLGKLLMRIRIDTRQLSFDF